VIAGPSTLPARSVSQATFGCLVGALLYRLTVALALNTDFLGLRPSDVQLVTAVLVALTLIWQARPLKKRGWQQKPKKVP
jgi:putative tryptophan/tyrosine transport system permease protein